MPSAPRGVDGPCGAPRIAQLTDSTCHRKMRAIRSSGGSHMEGLIADLLKEFEDGKMTRRQLIQSLALAAAAAASGGDALAQTSAAQPKPPIPPAFEPAPWKTVGLDHIAYA